MKENAPLGRFLDGFPPHRFESLQRALHRQANGVATKPNLVGAVGLEPTYPKMADFKSAASANSATLPRAVVIIARAGAIAQRRPG